MRLEAPKCNCAQPRLPAGALVGLSFSNRRPPYGTAGLVGTPLELIFSLDECGVIASHDLRAGTEGFQG